MTAVNIVHIFKFAVLLGVVFIVELAIGIGACLYKAELDKSLTKSLKDSIVRSNGDDVIAWDNAQRKLMCCGVTEPADWVDFAKTQAIPASCCKPQLIDTITNDCKDSQAHNADRYYQVRKSAIICIIRSIFKIVYLSTIRYLHFTV